MISPTVQILLVLTPELDNPKECNHSGWQKNLYQTQVSYGKSPNAHGLTSRKIRLRRLPEQLRNCAISRRISYYFLILDSQQTVAVAFLI